MRLPGTIAICVGLVAAACSGPTEQVTGAAEVSVPTGETVVLPEPRAAGVLSLEEAIAGRRSIREYGDEWLTPEEIGQILWAAQGITQEGGAGRAAPSAGGTYPLEVYLATADGVFRYLPEGHALEVLSDRDVRVPLSQAALDQEWVAEGAAVVVVAGVYARTEEVYGARAERYVQMEAGHAAQNLLLQAVALGLGAVPVGAFDDADVQAALGIPGDHEPLYLIPVGRPD